MLECGWISPEEYFVNKRQSDGSAMKAACPEIVKSYETFMGGVKRWWVGLFFNFIDLAVVNAFVL